MAKLTKFDKFVAKQFGDDQMLNSRREWQLFILANRILSKDGFKLIEDQPEQDEIILLDPEMIGENGLRPTWCGVAS